MEAVLLISTLLFPFVFLFAHLIARYSILRPLYVGPKRDIGFPLRGGELAALALLVILLASSLIERFYDVRPLWCIIGVTEAILAVAFFGFSVASATTRANVDDAWSRMLCIFVAGLLAHVMPLAALIAFYNHEWPLGALFVALSVLANLIPRVVTRPLGVADQAWQAVHSGWRPRFATAVLGVLILGIAGPFVLDAFRVERKGLMGLLEHPPFVEAMCCLSLALFTSETLARTPALASVDRRLVPAVWAGRPQIHLSTAVICLLISAGFLYLNCQSHYWQTISGGGTFSGEAFGFPLNVYHVTPIIVFWDIPSLISNGLTLASGLVVIITISEWRLRRSSNVSV